MKMLKDDLVGLHGSVDGEIGNRGGRRRFLAAIFMRTLLTPWGTIIRRFTWADPE